MIDFIPKQLLFDLISCRRTLHKFPERSRQEYKTQSQLMTFLDQYQIPYKKIADTGLIVTVKGNKSNPCIAFRADMDGLPIQEKTSLSFQSENDGVMHACGHDIHMTIALGLAVLFHNDKSKLNGTVKLFFQPDEEEQAGSKKMIQAGCMITSNVDAIVGCHVMPYLPVGDIELKAGALNASTCSVIIRVHGKSTHAAYPNDGIDAIYVTSKIYIALQELTKTQIESSDPVILSFGIISGGTKANIITDQVVIKGTLRTINNSTKEQTKQQIKSILTRITSSYNAKGEVIFYDGYPPLINDQSLYEESLEVAKDSSFIKAVHKKIYPSMGAEDFGYYQKYAPGIFSHIGCSTVGESNPSPLHSPTFIADESAIKVGILYHYNLIHTLIQRRQIDE